MAGKISSENTFAHDFSKKLRSRLVSRRLRSNMDNCWLPLALYDIFRHHPVFIYIISNLKYCVTPPFDLNVNELYITSQSSNQLNLWAVMDAFGLKLRGIGFIENADYIVDVERWGSSDLPETIAALRFSFKEETK